MNTNAPHSGDPQPSRTAWTIWEAASRFRAREFSIMHPAWTLGKGGGGVSRAWPSPHLNEASCNLLPPPHISSPQLFNIPADQGQRCDTKEAYQGKGALQVEAKRQGWRWWGRGMEEKETRGWNTTITTAVPGCQECVGDAGHDHSPPRWHGPAARPACIHTSL